MSVNWNSNSGDSFNDQMNLFLCKVAVGVGCAKGCFILGSATKRCVASMMESAKNDYENRKYGSYCMKSTCAVITGASVGVITVAALVTVAVSF